MSDYLTWLSLTQVQMSCSFAAAGLIWYDYVLTLDQEIQQMWRNQFSGIALLFYVNRYALLLDSIILVLMQFRWVGLSDERFVHESVGAIPFIQFYICSCGVYVRIEMVCNILVGICAAVFYATRTYALYARKVWFLLLTLGLGLIGPLINAYTWSKMTPVLALFGDLGQSCGFILNIDPYAYERWLMGARGSALAADTVILILTFRETFKFVKFGSGFGRSTVIGLMAQEGAIYFVILAILNVAGIALGRLEAVIALMPLWVATLTSLLISRFVLELRTTCYGSTIERSGLGSSRGLQTLRFNRPAEIDTLP